MPTLTHHSRHAVKVGLQKLARGKDTPPKIRMKAIEQLIELETGAKIELAEPIEAKPNKLRQLLTEGSNEGLPARALAA